jgi:hypothetical protein
MGRSADRVSIYIKRGDLISDDHHLVGQWFKYRMQEIYQNLRNRVADATDLEGRQLAWKFSMTEFFDQGAGPTHYHITGASHQVGMTEIFMEFIARAGDALRTMKPFVTGSTIQFDHSFVRSPWVHMDYDTGLKINTSKRALKVRCVGKAARLSNGRPFEEMFPGLGSAGPIVHDTQIQDLWVVGETNAVDQSVSMIRDVFRKNSPGYTNDKILSAINSKLSSKVALVVHTATDNHDGQGFFYCIPNAVDTHPEFKKRMERYNSTMAEFGICTDKFDWSELSNNLMCPSELVQRVIQQTAHQLMSYTHSYVRSAIDAA